MATSAELIEQRRRGIGINRPQVGGQMQAAETGRGSMDTTGGKLGRGIPELPVVDLDRETNKKVAQQKYYRDQDLAQGRARGEEIFGEGSLGRVSEGNSQDVNDIIAARRANLQGYTPEEMATLRNQADDEIGKTMGTALRIAKGNQNQAGLNSGIAAGQNTQIAKAAISAKMQAEQGLLLDQISKRREALTALSGEVGNAEKLNLAKQQYNQEQGNKEKIGGLTTEFGYAGLGAADRSGVMQQVVGQAQADAMKAQAAKQGGKK